MAIPYWGIRLNPEPRDIPTRQELVIPDSAVESHPIQSFQDLRGIVRPTDSTIRQLAGTIASTSCEGSRICHAKALYYHVRDNYDYVADPVNTEYIEDPLEFVRVGGGDCESGTILLASLLESIGVDTQLVFIPGHAYLRAKLDAPKSYQRDGWVYLDWTCGSCGFGELPLQNLGKNERYLEVP
jgi:transglutaminase-like putative cysteine protease